MTYEPVAWMSPDESSVALTKLHESWVPLYTGTEEKYRYGTPLLDAFTTPPAWTQAHWTEYERSIAAAEREACAKVCDEIAANHNNPTASECASAIRARNKT